MEKYLNINLVKNILYDEIKKYYEYSRKITEIFNKYKMIDDIINVLENKDYKKLYKNYSKYESFIRYFNLEDKGNLNNIYFYSAFLANNNFDKEDEFIKSKIEFIEIKLSILLNQLKNEKANKDKEIQENQSPVSYEDFNKYKQIMSSFKNGELINYDQQKIIENLLLSKGYTSREIVILLEKVKINNTRINLDKKNIKFNPRKGYEIVNVLSYGYEKLNLPVSNNINKDKVASLIETIKIVFEDLDFEQVKELLPTLDLNNNFSSGYNKEEFEYLMMSLLIYYQEKLFYNFKELTDLKNYNDKGMKKIIVEDYNDYLNKYLFLREYMDEVLERYKENDNIKIIDEDIEKPAKEVYYSVRATDGVNTFFENDLKDIPKDLYDGVKNLIIDFRMGKLSFQESKDLNEAFPGLKEIRNDQVRILFRHIKNNEYVIVGIFQKKRDLDINSLRKFYKRPYDNIVHSDECEAEIFGRMDEKKHSGGRKNS